MSEGLMRRFKPRLDGIVERTEFIVAKCAGRRVLHVGAADWPVQEVRVRDGSLLHDRITTAASGCLGIDLNAEAVAWLAAYGRDNLRVANAEEPLDAGLFDLVVAGEVIEHMSNPGLFLERCKDSLASDGELLVTVPNAFAARGIIHAATRREKVHPDHNYYFSAVTLRSLLERHGYEVSTMLGYAAPSVSRAARLRGLGPAIALRLSPLFADGIIAVARPPQS